MELKLARAFQQSGVANMPSAVFLKVTPILLEREATNCGSPSLVLCTLSLLTSLQLGLSSV